jgi:quercetin dioxygenase-like cupin family protein
MLRRGRTEARALLAGAALLATACAARAAPEVDAEGFVRATPAQVAWTTQPNGVRNAILYGDPRKPGLYVVRSVFPPGIMSAPHFHTQDRVVVVLEGTWYTGTGDRWDAAATRPLGPGSYMIHPRGQVHFDGARDEEVTVQITGVGPVETVFSQPGEEHMGRPHPLAPRPSRPPPPSDSDENRH